MLWPFANQACEVYCPILSRWIFPTRYIPGALRPILKFVEISVQVMLQLHPARRDFVARDNGQGCHGMRVDAAPREVGGR